MRGDKHVKIKGEIGGLENTGDGIMVTIINAKRIGLPDWREYQPNFKIEIPMGRAKYFHIGRIVTVNIVLD